MGMFAWTLLLADQELTILHAVCQLDYRCQFIDLAVNLLRFHPLSQGSTNPGLG